MHKFPNNSSAVGMVEILALASNVINFIVFWLIAGGNVSVKLVTLDSIARRVSKKLTIYRSITVMIILHSSKSAV